MPLRVLNYNEERAERSPKLMPVQAIPPIRIGFIYTVHPFTMAMTYTEQVYRIEIARFLGFLGVLGGA